MNFKFPKGTHNAGYNEDIKIIYEDQILWGNANVIFREYKRQISYPTFFKNAHKNTIRKYTKVLTKIATRWVGKNYIIYTSI